MEFIAPPLNAVLYLRLKLNNGQSMRMALEDYLLNESDEFSIDVLNWYRKRQQNPNHLYESNKVFRNQVIWAIQRGLRGEPVSGLLHDLEKEMIQVSNEDIQVHLEKLPVIMIIPLLIFQLPGFMLVLVGPIFIQLFNMFGLQ